MLVIIRFAYFISTTQLGTDSVLVLGKPNVTLPVSESEKAKNHCSVQFPKMLMELLNPVNL
jgi:hypothetical protein